MAQFKYTALSRNGERVTGIMEGYNELDAAARVKENYNVILKITPIAEKKDDVGFLNMDIGGSAAGELRLRDSNPGQVMAGVFYVYK